MIQDCLSCNKTQPVALTVRHFDEAASPEGTKPLPSVLRSSRQGKGHGQVSSFSGLPANLKPWDFEISWVGRDLRRSLVQPLLTAGCALRSDHRAWGCL